MISFLIQGVDGQIAPVNDACKDAISLQTSDQAVLGSTADATADGLNFCGEILVNSPGVWYYYQLPSTLGRKIVQVSTCTAQTTFDTAVTVFAGSCADLQCISGRDNDQECDAGSEVHSTVSWQASPSIRYHILVHGGAPQHNGTFGLVVTATEPLDAVDKDKSAALVSISFLWLFASVLSLAVLLQ